jgi:hypothetical protein
LFPNLLDRRISSEKIVDRRDAETQPVPTVDAMMPDMVALHMFPKAWSKTDFGVDYKMRPFVEETRASVAQSR